MEQPEDSQPPVDRLVMRLFVWGQFCPDYTDGLAFAIAENLEQARALVIASIGFVPSNWGVVQEFSVNDPIAFSVYGGS
jgi:hypothetical protein